MNKLMHGSNVAGQSIVDRMMAAKHTVAGQSLQKVIGKATTEEVLGPKRKHLDYLLQCTNEPNVSIPQMANFLIERTQSSNWVVVFKALVTTHNILNSGNERFTQYLASNNCSFNLNNFMDKTGNQGYDMSTFIRRYAKYLNEKAISYRLMAFDFCKVKRGKEDGLLRTMNTDKLLKTLPVLQTQLDALLEFDATPNELSNGVINAAFMLMFKDLIRLFACYNDGIINLLEKYFEMNKKNCREALDIYKKFLVRMDRVCEFLKVAECVGIDKGDIPDLAKAPSSLLDALEQHLISLENSKKLGVTTVPKPTAGVTAVISNYAAASQAGTAPGAGCDVAQISDEERQRILEDEQRQLDQMKQQRLKQMSAAGGGGSPISSASSASNASASAGAAGSCAIKSFGATSTGSSMPASMTSPSRSLNSSPRAGAQTASSAHDDYLLAFSSMPITAQAGATYMPDQAVLPSNGNAHVASALQMSSNPFDASVSAQQPVGSSSWGASSLYTGAGQQPQYASNFTNDANFATVFGGSSTVSKSPFDGHSDLLRPMQPTVTGATCGGAVRADDRGGGRTDRGAPRQDNLLTQDLDGSLASLAGNLSIRPEDQVKKVDHMWTTPVGERKLTGGPAQPSWGQASQPQGANTINPWGATQQTGATVTGSSWTQPGVAASAWNQPISMSSAAYPSNQMAQPMPMMMGASHPGMISMQPKGAFPVSMGQPGFGGPQQQFPMGWGVSPQQQQQQQQQMMFSQQQQLSTANKSMPQQPRDPFGAL